MEMTDVGKEKDMSGDSDADAGKVHYGDQENPLGSFAVDGFKDFEEFVLNFDDYDLWSPSTRTLAPQSNRSVSELTVKKLAAW